MTTAEKKGWKTRIIFELFSICWQEKLPLNIDVRTLGQCADLLIEAHERLNPEAPRLPQKAPNAPIDKIGAFTLSPIVELRFALRDIYRSSLRGKSECEVP